jgi:hypothetical protein
VAIYQARVNTPQVLYPQTQKDDDDKRLRLLRRHLRLHLTALREENARILRATLVCNRVLVAYEHLKLATSLIAGTR